MKIRLLAISLCAVISTRAQQNLTVEKIMQDPKWIGTSPSNVFWSTDSKKIYFNWNPDTDISDSVYSYSIDSKGTIKIPFLESQLLSSRSNGVYNNAHSLLVFTHRGDLFLQNLISGKITRITQTEETESNPRFVQKDLWVVYLRNQNLFAWDIQSGITKQLTNFTRSAESSSAAIRQMSGNNPQERWLQEQQLELMQVLKERKQKKDQQDHFIKSNKETDTLKIIAIGEKGLQNLQVSPDARYITYRLFQPPANSKNTIVPNYVTESGFTTDISGRTKVGAPLGKYEFFVYDRSRDSIYLVSPDSIPGITDLPDYAKDYPSKYANKKPTARGVIINGPFWNEAGTFALVDIRSQDNKDRWLMQLDAASGKLKLIDRQRDEAWIGGPGIGGGGFGSRIGWINDALFYFQSETTGYSHLYTYNTNTQIKKALTFGKYEVQDLVLSKNKDLFYLLTNEEHPGKQNWYRIKTDGSKKEKITSLEGGYEVTLSPDEKWIAYRYSYINKPWELYLQENIPGKQPVQITFKSMSDAFKAYSWKEPRIITIPASDGEQVYARIYEPTSGKKNNAAVIFVHGAGYLQNVHYWWSQYFREYMFNNLLADKGYTVLDIDYRASSGYGRNWRTGIYRFMGGKDLDDHVDAAKFLVSQKGIDPERIGMYGGSYGGFMTLMALFTKPDIFKAGAALRPVTDWAHYNHGYTSNILNEPFTDSIAYARSSPINFASGLKNHLLICHGMVDVNVHFQDAVRLTQRLIELGKDNWELAPYPMEDHGFVEPSSWTDEYKRILKLFDNTLLK